MSLVFIIDWRTVQVYYGSVLYSSTSQNNSSTDDKTVAKLYEGKKSLRSEERVFIAHSTCRKNLDSIQTRSCRNGCGEGALWPLLFQLYTDPKPFLLFLFCLQMFYRQKLAILLCLSIMTSAFFFSERILLISYYSQDIREVF